MTSKYYKTLVSIILTVCLLATSAFAVVAEESSTVQPRYTGISTFWTCFDINNGVAECESSILITSASNSGKLIMSLQISSDGVNWSSYKTWSASGSGAILLDETYNVRSGYYFRIHCNANVYDADGNIVGMNVKQSDPIYCE